jgi:hypothetical protein
MAYKSKVTITRPANVTAYTALDVVGQTANAIIQFDGIPARGSFLITSASLRIDVSAVPAGMSSYRLHLYNGSPGSALADNAAFNIPSGDRGQYQGSIDIPVPSDRGDTLFARYEGSPNAHVDIDAGLYGYLETVGGYTPAGNSEVYVVTVSAIKFDE